MKSLIPKYIPDCLLSIQSKSEIINLMAGPYRYIWSHSKLRYTVGYAYRPLDREESMEISLRLCSAAIEQRISMG